MEENEIKEEAKKAQKEADKYYEEKKKETKKEEEKEEKKEEDEFSEKSLKDFDKFQISCKSGQWQKFQKFTNTTEYMERRLTQQMEGLKLNEKLILRSIIEKPDLIYQIEKDNFYYNQSQTVYQAMYHLNDYEKGPITLSKENIFNEVIRIDDKFDIHALQEIFDFEDFKVDDFDYYKNTLKKDSIKYKSGNLLEEINKVYFLKGKINIEELKKVRDVIDGDIGEYENTGENNLLTIGEAFSEHEQILDERRKGKHYATGNGYLDKNLVSGFQPGKMTLIFGATSQGKTTFALNLANGQINKSIPGIYISLDMMREEIIDRFASLRLKIPYNEFKTRFDYVPTERIMEEFQNERKSLENNNRYFIFRRTRLSIEGLRKLIRDAKEKAGVDYLVVTIDILDKITDFLEPVKGVNTATVYQSCSGKICDMAAAENVHIVNIYQANRDTDSTHITKKTDIIKKLKPDLINIRNSSALEKDHDNIISIMRPKYYCLRYFPAEEEIISQTDIMYVQIQKQRDGDIRLLKYNFEPEIFKLEKYDKEIHGQNFYEK